MDTTMTQIPNNTSVNMDSGSMSSVGISSTETPPPGYMSEDGDPMDQNDNLSECIVGDRTIFAGLEAIPPLPRLLLILEILQVSPICRLRNLWKRHQLCIKIPLSGVRSVTTSST